MKIQFWGATDEVTGSMTFIHLPGGIIMIDSGLTQGTQDIEKLNLVPIPINPKDIKAVVITHAHLDHSGYLPRLVKKGFKGTIYCTPPTAELMKIILQDSAKLNDDFYSLEDVQATMNLVKFKEWHNSFEELEAKITFLPAGHILGASSVKIEALNKALVFSGDLGRFDDPILPEHESAPAADMVIMESTYGGKNRKGNLEEELYNFLRTVARENRIGIIASFAVARAQMILTLISDFYEKHPEEKVRVCIDSPMMAKANKVYRKYSKLTRHPDSVYSALEKFDLIEYQGEWESLKKKEGPLIIISASGMLTGGRIQRHLQNWQIDKKAILFLPGYQGVGTPGRDFVEGKRQMKGPDDEIFTWFGEVWTSEEFSSHADQDDLLRWLGHENKEAQICLLHGEAEAKRALKQELLNQGQSSVHIPTRGEIIELLAPERENT